MHYQDGRYAEAAATMHEAPALVEKQYGRDDTHVAQNLNNLALIYRAMQRYGEAEPLYRRAVVIADRTPRMKSAGDLARMYVAAGNYGAAEPLYLRVIAWQHRHVGPQFGVVANTEGQLAEVYAKLGRTEDADRLARRSHRSPRRRAQGLVPQPVDACADAQKSAAVRIDLARPTLTLAISCS
ncbi:tetratricopeptide repeat protein [Tahibacter caeni]|uniref:tetratricopeptide repeat protein n=1 Tax=Tahibacter caeni TaxID=1453545 RepID=UPI002147759A